MSEEARKRITRLDYCQFLLSTPLNYTMTYFGEHSERFGHDAINRYMAEDRIIPGMLWENVRIDVVTDEEGIIIFDDVVLDKEHSEKIELVRRQWSGNAKSVIKGIGVVTCVYVNPKTDQFWIIDYRIFAPDEDHKSKLDHMDSSDSASSAVCGVGKFDHAHGMVTMPPRDNSITIHTTLSRQNTRRTRPDWPQKAHSSAVTVTVQPTNAIYGAVCRWFKRDNE